MLANLFKIHRLLVVMSVFITGISVHAQGLISHDFDDGKMGPFVDCTTQNPNYAKVVNNRLRTYWKQTSYNSSNRSTKGAEACGDPVHNGVGYLTYKHCWMGFVMNIDEGYMQGDVGVGGLAQVFGFDHARGQSTWTAMLDMKDGDLAWMDRRGSGNTRADVVVYEDFPRGVDMDIIIHNVLSGNNAGMVEIYVNGILKYSAYNINIGMGEFDGNDTQTNESSTEFKIGQYNHSDAATNEIRIVDYDNISWYDGEDGYDIVNPDKGTSSCLNTTALIQAECYDDMFEITTEASEDGTDNIGNVHNGDWAVYNNIDLTDVYSVKARIATVKDNVAIEVRLDAIDGELLATIPVTNTGAWQTWETEQVNLGLVDGTHDVYFVFTGGTGGILNANWFGFSQEFICSNTTDLIEAECYDGMEGIKTEGSTEGSLNIGWIQNGDWTRYNDIDLTDMQSIKARVSGKTTGNIIEVHLDAVDGELIGEIPVKNTGDNQNWTTDSVNISTVSGVHDLYLVFIGEEGYLYNINWVGFSEDKVVVTNLDGLTESSFSVFPNPTSGHVQFSEERQYQVSNLLGENIVSGNGTHMDLSGQPKGVYLLQVEGKLFKIIKK